MFARQMRSVMTKIIFWAVLLGVATSCSFNNNQYSSYLKQLDSQLDENPKMVLDSLKKLDPQKLDANQQAYYYLLNASAIDKNYMYLDNDSTLRISLEHYRDHNDYYKLAKCQYFLGKYAEKRQQTKTAYELFKQAEINFKTSKEKDPHLLGLIYYHIGRILKQQNNQVEAESFVDESYKIFMDENDTISAAHSLKLKASLLISSKKYSEAKTLLFKSLNLISTIQASTEKIIEAKNSILPIICLSYIKTDSLNKALEYAKKSLTLYEKENLTIPSQFYWNVVWTAFKLNQLDSARYYCNRMIAAATNENNIPNLSNGYKTLSSIEEKEGNYKKACELKNYFNKQKDQHNTALNRNNILELERNYNKAETERLLLKAENGKLRAYAISTIIIFLILIIGFPLYHRHKRLQIECNKLSQKAKHNEWGFLITKEFITENHIAYDEFERILNREKSIKNITSDLYNKLHEILIQQKANYSGRLFDRLTSFDGAFGTKFQKQFPDFNSDELLMATMIHHQWKLKDMTTIFHISIDAVRKRKTRLTNKISSKLKKEIDLDEYLTNF